jgi:hypothetical protein
VNDKMGDVKFPYCTDIHESIYVSNFCSIHFCCKNEQAVEKVKVNMFLCLTKHHAKETQWGSEGIAPRIHNFGTRRK